MVAVGTRLQLKIQRWLHLYHNGFAYTFSCIGSISNRTFFIIDHRVVNGNYNNKKINICQKGLMNEENNNIYNYIFYSCINDIM